MSDTVWPEKMGQNAVNEFDNPKEFELFIGDDNKGVVAVYGETMELVQARAKQICALPKMVELLKVVAGVEHRMNSNTNIKAQAILREIGEIE